MFGSRSLQLDERRQASRRSFEAWILTSRKVFSEESEWKSESSYWLLKSEDKGSGKMAAHDGITALHIAVNNVKEDAIRLLLSRKADPFVPYGVGFQNEFLQ
ncbi:uncharacterized protein TNCV_2598371 [Trichonephila clavipes]|nr:uncharacterized protein TNCV_2598371 [Trichonephila clavipes]